jgi:hypothetical protein
MDAARTEAAPMTERFNLDTVILGLASDLFQLRAGSISVEDARARADLAKQIFNGVRLVINGQRVLQSRAHEIGTGTKKEP